MKYLVLGLTLVALTLTAFIIGLSKDPRKIPSNLINSVIPNFDLDYIGGGINHFTKEDLLKIKNVKIVNVFASWCPPCKIEHPQISKLSEKYSMFGINQKDKQENLFNWLEELGNPYEGIGLDKEGRASIEWGVYGVPETFILDSNSKIRYKHVGPIMERDLKVFEEVINLLKNEN